MYVYMYVCHHSPTKMVHYTDIFVRAILKMCLMNKAITFWQYNINFVGSQHLCCMSFFNDPNFQ